MSYFLFILIAAILIIAACILAMAVGVILRNKSFKSCACASITYKGERIDCPAACPEPGNAAPESEQETPASVKACCRVLEAAVPSRSESREE